MEERTRILLVEDDKVDQMAFERFVEREALPYDYVVAESVAAAREILADAQFDAALLDYSLGDGTAFDLFGEIRDTPIVIITGSGDEEIAIEAMKAGASDYLVKDPEGNYLKTLPVTVENAIRRRRAEEELGQYREHLEELVAERTAELQRANKELARTNEQLVAEIAERVRAEQALRESEARYRTVVEYQTDLICRFLPDGTLTFVNQAYCHHHSQQRQELIGHSFVSLILPEDRERVVQHLASFSQETLAATIEYRAVAAGGKVRWQQWINRPIFDEQDNLIEFQAVGRDVTERKRAEEALAQEQYLLLTLMDNAPDGIYFKDSDSRFIRINAAQAARFGLSDPAQAMGKTDFDFFTEEHARLAHADEQEVIRSGQPLVGKEEKEMWPNGQETWVSTTKLPLRDEEGQIIGTFGISRNITEHKRTEERVRQQERLAAVGQLAGGIAHDFNNLLTTIMLYAQMGLGKRDLPPDVTRSFETILAESRKAAELVQQILDFSRHAMINVRPLDLESFTEKVITILRRTIPENIHLTLETGAQGYIVEADPTRVQQALMNLATNARDAQPRGGELRFELSKMQLKPDEEPPVAEMGPGEWVCLAVSDTGTGMTEEVRAHLFEPFFTTKEVGEGTGLGLAQVYGIVRQHEGYIGVETEVGQGTTFRIYLPASGAEEVVEEEKVAAAPRGQGETILLVEDNEKLLEGGQALLESLGYRVLTGANGREALEVYGAEGGADLVITDLVMPEMGGQRLMRELRKTTPGLKGLAITGYAVQKDLEGLREEGFLDLVHKPFDMDELAQVVRRALDES